MAGRTIEIDVILNDKTNGKVKGIQKDLQALDKQAERLNQRIKAVGLQKFAATLRLIDKVSDPASRINSLLKKIAGGTYRVTMRINDSALAGIRKIESALLRISGRAWNVAVNVGGTAMNKINGLMSGALMGAGMFAPMAGMMGVGYGVGNAISSAASFEQQMSKVQAIRQLSKDSAEMKALTQQAKDLGMQTAWTRQQVGEAQYYQALAGWETPQILKATPHMLNLASAGGMDLGAASDMLTDAMTAFGLKATDQYTNAKGQAIDLPEYFADMFAKVQASSNTGSYQLKEATKYSASTIGTMFANIGGQEGVQARTEAARQMLIMTGLMANAGIKGSMAGTGINTIFNRLAGENRNTHFAEKLLGLEHAAENGNMLMPLDFIKAFRNKIQGGMSVDDFLQVAEELSGEKIHADTRRKINSTIENALKNGGKLGSSDMLKIGSMMAGLENAPKLMAMVFQDIEALEAKMNNVEGTAGQMANDMLDNLAGSFTRLGSAWDAFQQDLFTGTAGDGLRNFVDALTEILTRANNLFKDGIQISDFGKIIGDVVGRLKDKVMELDGIGSLLAGGALVMGLKKIISLGQSALNVFKGVGAAGATALGGTAAKGAAGAAAAMSVSTMNVKAGVVNLAGAIKGGGGVGGVAGTAGKGAAGATALTPVALAQQNLAKARAAQDTALAAAWAAPGVAWRQSALRMAQRQTAQAEAALVNARVAAYNEQIAKQKEALALAREEAKTTSRFAGMKSAAGGAAAFAGLFSLLDVMSLKSANAERLAAAPEEQRAQIARENRQAEWEASVGGLGSVVGAAAGAALGSLAGPMGTMIGGMIGSVIGEKLGRFAGEEGAAQEVAVAPKRANVSQNQIEDIIAGRKPGTDKGFDQFGVMDRAKPGNWWLAPKAGQNYFGLGDEKHSTDIIKSSKTPTPTGWTPMPELQRGAGHKGWSVERSLEQANKETEQFAAEVHAREKEHWQKMDGMWKDNATALDYYSQQRDKIWSQAQHGGGGDSFTKQGNVAYAGTPTAEQLATEGQVAMPPITPPDTSPIDEWLSNFGAQITDGLSSIMDGAYETVSALGATISEGFSEMVTGASEIFAGFGEMVTSGLSVAQSAAEGALSMIQSAFTSAKDSVQAAWGELPGFFAGVFSGLGGAASAAGAAIYGGLTSVIGAVIGAWESAAATVSSIIATISAAASSVAGMIPSIGGGNIPAHAEGGFITSPEIALIGERGAEAIIPLDGSRRALELFKKTGEVLGVDSDGEGYSITGNGVQSSSGGTTVHIDLGGISFEINSEQDIVQSVRDKLNDVTELVATQLSKTMAGVHENQSLSA